MPRTIDPSQRDATAELARQEEHRRRLDLWRDSGVTRRHRDAIAAGITMESWPAEHQEPVRRAIAVVKAGGLLSILGPWGTGKSQLAAWLCYGCCLSMGRPAMYRRFADLIGEVRAEAYGEGGSDARVVQRLSRLGLLVIDELHERRWSEDEQLWLSRILDHRYGEKVPTVLIANVTKEQLRAAIGPAMIDRMREAGAVVELVGASRRGATE